MRRGFASDNSAGIHPAVLQAIAEANVGHVPAYGNDPYTEEATRRIRDLFGGKGDVYFTFNGTGANVLGLRAMASSYHAVICAQGAHISEDECGAPEKFTGCKLIPVAGVDGKLTVDRVRRAVKGVGDQHHIQPRVISISQTTEVGTVYRPEEIRELADFAHSQGMFLHVDGARIANACAALGKPISAVILESGVDVLSFGGTKNGLMMGEAVVILNPSLSQDFKYIRKQGMQLASKMRFIAAQFNAILTGGLWLKNASHANSMARLLLEELQSVPRIQVTHPVEANAVFAILPREQISRLQEKYSFYVWDESSSEVRWMTSFDTTEEDVRGFVRELRLL